jgi:hypothetical protein
MNRETAGRLIERYVESWKAGSLESFLATLSSEIVVTECDASTYRGIDEAKRWFAGWHAAPVNGRVLDWRIHRLFFDDEEEIATAQWAFRCVCHGHESAFLGASVVAFSGERIARIEEYRMDERQGG